jgi:hypothetical protein
MWRLTDVETLGAHNYNAEALELLQHGTETEPRPPGSGFAGCSRRSGRDHRNPTRLSSNVAGSLRVYRKYWRAAD